MSSVEDLVQAFLERRASEPDLAPERFAAAHDDVAGELLPALRAALEAESLLAQVAPPRPDSIGPYRIVREIGRGGMGVVYEGERDGQRAAVKVLLHAEMRGARSLERFRREAAALRRVEHPGVVRVRDEGTVDGAPWLAMDLVAGQPLAELVGRSDPRGAAQVVRALALAVQAVHDSGALHRDLKPSNVLIDERGQPVLCDFGLVQSDAEGSLTSTGELLGTPRYMAPEQVLGRPCDARTDVHALGLVLYELACGRPAHAGESRARILSGIVRGTAHPPRRVAAGVPRPLERIVLQATAVDASRRYASAQALAEDLARFLAGETVLARPPGPLSRAWSRARADPRRAGATLLAGLTLAALVAFLALRAAPSRSGPELSRALDRAAWAWIDGHERFARREALVARELAGEDHDVATLAAAIESGAFVPDADRAASRAGVTRFVGELERARAARLAGLPSDARALLDVATRRFETSSALAAELGWSLHELGEAQQAEAQFGRAVDLDGDSVLTHEARAAWLFERGRTREAVDSAHRAARLAALEGEPPTRLPKLLERARDHAELRAILRERLELRPDEDDTRFALAVSLDGDHLLGEAAAEYGELVRRAPDHAFGLAYLAYLQLGALGGRCARCVEAFRLAPEVEDVRSGADHLARALRADGGRDEDLLRTIVSIALDKGLREPIAAELRQLLSTRERSARTARLESAMRRLE